MNDLEARQLRYFVAVAEELHFGRAAERLGMAQPPLSRAIRELERQLGVRLLERSTRQVALTTAGEVLLRDARTALDAITAAARRARHAGEPTPALRLALKADYDAGLLPRILSAFQQEDAALPVTLLLGGKDEQVPALRDGRADVVLVPSPFDDRDLDAEPLVTERRLLALAATDPLATRPDLCLADLAGRLLPDGTPAEYGGYPLPPAASRPAESRPAASRPAESRPAASRSAGSPFTGTSGGVPRAAMHPATVETQRPSPDLTQIFSLIELGGVVWFPPESVARRHARPGIAYRAVSDLKPTTLCVAWPRDSRSPAIAALVRVATSVAAAAYPTGTAAGTPVGAAGDKLGDTATGTATGTAGGTTTGTALAASGPVPGVRGTEA